MKHAECWTYASKTITCVEDLPNHENLHGFVYKITDTKTGKFYIGKKALTHTRKTKISNKARKTTGTRKIYQRTTKQSDWLSYYGSSKDLLSDVQKYGPDRFKREILELCCSKKYLAFCELSYQIKYDVLKDNSYNGNILGRYYHRDMENCQ